MNKFLKLFLLFTGAVAIVVVIVTPSLSLIFEVNSDHITQLQSQSNAIAKELDPNPETLQSTVMRGARTIKNELKRADFLFIYSSQIAYNIICFLLCALIFRRFTFSKSNKIQDWQKSKGVLYLLTPLLLLSTLPIIGETLHLNRLLGIDWLIEQIGLNTNQKSLSNMIFSYAVFVPETKIELVSSLLFVAIVPAFGEELFFRGSLQKSLEQHLGSIHNTIFITAFLFSAMHMEITAFFYRFFLGVLLGYTFYWTKNLMIPILIHALNNGMTVFAMYYAFNLSGDNTDLMETGSQQPLALLVSVIGACLVLWIYYAHFKKNQENMTV